MKKLVALLVLGFLSVYLSFAQADDDDWALIAINNDDDSFFIKKDSPMLGKIGDVPVIGVVGKVKESDGSESVMAWFISLEACRDEEGMLVATNQAGKVIFRYPFNFKEEAVIGLVAQVMCNIASRKVEESKPKQKPKEKSLSPDQFIKSWHKDRHIGAIVV